jgi:gliding motility-associated-like protein
MKKVYSLCKFLFFLIGMTVITHGTAYGQCSVVSQGGANDPTCTYQSINGGAGAYFTLNVNNNVLYSFYWTPSGCPDVSGFCVAGNFETTTSAASPAVFVTGTGTIDIGFYESNTNWCGTSSAVLNYVITPPTTTQGPTTSATVCASTNSYTIPAGYSYEIGGFSGYGSVSWGSTGDGTFTNGTTTDPTYIFGPNDKLGSAPVLTMTADNGGCVASTTFDLTIDQAPTVASVGTPNQSVCNSFTTALTGNSATVGIGIWTIVSGPGGTSFTNVNNASTSITVTAYGTYIYKWTISNGVCPSTSANDTVSFYAPPSAASAGPTQNICGSTTSTALGGNTPAIGTGTWTQFSGPGTTTFSNAHSGASTATATTYGTYVYHWTIANGSCPSSTASITVNYYATPTTATAAGTLDTCGSLVSPPLGGNTPIIGTGAWSEVSGPGTAFFSSGGAGSSTASVSAYGSYIFGWTITNGTCTSTAYDTVNYYAIPTAANAGSAQNLCGTLIATLSGNTPATGTGLWTQVSGPGTTIFGNPASASTTATASVAGSYEYTWTISNGSCAPSSSSVDINFIATPTGGMIANTSYCSSTGIGIVSVTGVSNADEYQWSLPAGLSGSSGTSTITVGGNTPGTYTVTVTPIDTAFGVTCTGSPVTGTVSILALPVIDSVLSHNITCFGYTDSILVYATSSNGSLVYSINGNGSYPNSTGVFPGVSAGTYNVYVKDDSGCSIGYALNPVKVTQPSIGLNATSIVTPVGCAGDSNGTINLLASGGAGGYLYNWSSGQDIQIITGLPAGIYTGSVTDINGCLTTVTDTLANPAPVVTSITKTDVTCYGANNGSANLTINGGVPPYQILWDNFDTSADISNLGAGVYRVRVTDTYGCEHSDSISISAPAQLTTTIAVSNVKCFGTNTDTLTVIASGGNLGGYTYTWSPPVSTDSTAINVAPGQYNVTVTDTKGCTAVDSATVTQPLTALSAASVATPVTCHGDSNGSINLLASGGVGGYTYRWSSGQSIQIISGLPAGTYTGSVTDANGCVATVTDILQNPAALTSTLTTAGVSCYGGNNGQASVSAAGGVLPYSYLWTNFDTSQTLTNLSAGQYGVIVTDSNGCRQIDTGSITQPTALSATVTVRNVGCSGGNTGSVVVHVSGGTPGPGGYVYSWSPVASATDSVSGVGAGTYYVTVSDANGCSITDSATVTQIASNLTAISIVTDITCHNSDNGAITVLPSGGSGGYTYSWTGTNQTTSTVTGLSAGLYTVTVTDGNGCSTSLSNSLSNPTAITSSITGTNVTCAGADNGSAMLTVSGGTPGYTFLWSNFDTSQNLANVAAGLYRVIITDSNGCKNYDSIIITQPTALSATVTVRNVGCSGGNTGSVVVHVSGGTPGPGGYVYSWSPVASATDSVSGVGAGTYYVTVSDANGCSITDSATVTQIASNLTAISIVTDITCHNSDNGAITVLPSGGSGGYTYSWTGTNQTTSTVTGLSAGLYTVTVTDGNGCSASLSNSLSNPTAITSNITGTNVTCAGADNGSAMLTVSGGTPGYTFLWSNFDTSQNLANVAAGLYRVIITDSNGCKNYDSIIIVEPLPVTVTDSVSPVVCNGGSNGSIILTVTGGTGAYTYSWTPAGPNSPDNTGLSAGTYSVTVSDVNHCTATLTTTLIDPTLMTVSHIFTQPSCNGYTNGTIDLFVAGGTPQYTFHWSPNGPNAPSNTNLSAGTYLVTVTDAHGCQVDDSIVVTEPSPMYVSGIQKNVSCHDYNDGFILPTPYGGTLPYSYQWYLGTDTFAPLGPITENITQLSGGSYYLIVTDANGCQVPFTRTIVNPDSLIISLTATNLACANVDTGSVAVIVMGGTLPYQFLWNNFVTDSFQTGLAAGNYAVVVTDSNGCHQNESINLTQPQPISIAATVIDPLCNGNSNGSVSLAVQGGTPQYSYSWNTTPTQTSSTASNLTSGEYTVTVTDSKGCTQTDSALLTDPAALYVNTAINDPTCSGGDNGFVSLDARGGTAPYLYNWSTTPAQTGNVASALASGTYYATITDAQGCNLYDTAVVVSPQPVVVTLDAGSSTCAGSAGGIVVVSATGGLAPYSFGLGDIIQSSDTFRNLSVGTYTVAVTDANGCLGTSSVLVSPLGSFTDTLTAIPSVILAGETVQLYARATSDTIITSYIWYPSDSLDFSGCGSTTDCDSPTAKPTQSQTYIVTVVNARGCSISDTVFVRVSDEASAFVPSAFTPNGDGLNDKFEMDILGATTINVKIWDRWGELVFSNPDQANGMSDTHGWDGTFRGKPVQFDTYTYQLVITYSDGHEQTVAGTLSVLR